MERGGQAGVYPVMDLGPFYAGYSRGEIGIAGCVASIYGGLEKGLDALEDIRGLAGRMMDWARVKQDIYPVLLSVEGDQGYAAMLAHIRVLDLMVVYMIRTELPGGMIGSIKVTNSLLENYGISLEELHSQAMENLKKDGYCFEDMEGILREGYGLDIEGGVLPQGEGPKMYVLSNRGKRYGAAGILDKEMVREFADGKDYYILPSSIHETIFVESGYVGDGRDMDLMVAEVNRMEVLEEDRLADHSYYYDAAADEIRICA